MQEGEGACLGREPSYLLICTMCTCGHSDTVILLETTNFWHLHAKKET
jgi:hypothetical protein